MRWAALGLALMLAGSAAAEPVAQRPRQLDINGEGPLVVEQLRLLAKAESGLKKRDIVVRCHQYRFHPWTFYVTLIGRDGREAARWTRPVTAAELFALVDAMPMRRAELRAVH